MRQGPRQSVLFARPDWLEGFHSDDLDEVRAYTGRWDGEHSRVAHGSGPLGFESAALTGSVCPVAWGCVAVPVTIRGALPHSLLHFGAVGHYRLGRREHVPGPHEAMFIAGGVEFTRHGQTGSMLAIAPETGRLLEEISARGAGRPGRLIPTTRKLTISQVARSRLATALGQVVSARAPGGDPCLARRGMSPLRFVTERRLAAVHRRLVRAGPTDSVTTIATSVGFSHMGRFASSYRQAFGESPSATLGRALRKRT